VTIIQVLYVYGKNGFAEVSENLVRYRFENNFAGIKIIIGRSSWLLEC